MFLLLYHLLMMMTTFLSVSEACLRFKGKGCANVCPTSLPFDDDHRDGAVLGYHCEVSGLAQPLQAAFISPYLTSGSVLSR